VFETALELERMIRFDEQRCDRQEEENSDFDFDAANVSEKDLRSLLPSKISVLTVDKELTVALEAALLNTGRLSVFRTPHLFATDVLSQYK
jgi:hypothetical protein